MDLILSSVLNTLPISSPALLTSFPAENLMDVYFLNTQLSPNIKKMYRRI